MRNIGIWAPYSMAGALCVLGIYTTWQGSSEDKKKYEECGKQQVSSIPYTVERHDVDQVFRDHNGIRTYHTNDSGTVVESKYGGHIGSKIDEVGSPRDFPFPDVAEKHLFKTLETGLPASPLMIYKDLEQGTQGYAQVLHYELNKCHTNCNARVFTFGIEFCDIVFPPSYYAEIHLPKNQKLTPGFDSYIKAKIPVHEPMSEIE